jgi:DNA-binding NtrC family response regulator
MYRRVGGTEPLRTDFRLVCATHQNLDEMVRAGTFREDLYFRISAFPVKLPALRDRAADIPLLCEAFLSRRDPRKRLHPEALSLLTRHRFPGNIRELRNIIDRMVLLADGDDLLPEHLPAELRSDAAERADAGGVDAVAARPLLVTEVRPLDGIESDYLRWAERRIPDRAALARALGISERTLYRKLDALRRRAETI